MKTELVFTDREVAVALLRYAIQEGRATTKTACHTMRTELGGDPPSVVCVRLIVEELET